MFSNVQEIGLLCKSSLLLKWRSSIILRQTTSPYISSIKSSCPQVHHMQFRILLQRGREHAGNYYIRMIVEMEEILLSGTCENVRIRKEIEN